ncbi:MAG: tetratricopeptide repeat protein [Phycisphaerae bacterium]|nr:tetratricopeptide repeat protein [Phycisphaerae bacterium]MDD5380311.1 tetratricopeptide repeat protein [Phycisphaerae bacterium]
MIKQKKVLFFISLALAASTLIAYEQVRLNGFVNYDDDLYVTENPNVNKGISGNSIIWAFTTGYCNNWHPLTWLSHMLDCQVFGLKPAGHHIVNLFFHIANTLLLFWILKKMTGGIWQSAFVAAVFALHPLHVESVAWIAERKDVLSGFFWMLTIAAYVRYAKRPDIKKYLLAVLFLCLGLMSKPMTATLPFVLLLLDWWPLDRFQSKGGISPKSKSAKAGYQKASLGSLIKEKIPLFALAVILSVITFAVQQKGKPTEISAAVPASIRITTAPLNVRISNALVSYVSYMVKTVYPKRLAVLYPHPTDSLPKWEPIVCFVLLAAITAGVIYLARRQRYLATGWLWYLGTLVPVIGLVQVGAQAMADRYTYLPSIGIFIMAAWGAGELLAKRRYQKLAMGTAAGIVLAILMICTHKQVSYWQNSSTLFGHTLAVTEKNFIMHDNYGVELLNAGQLDEAAKQFDKSLQINPEYLKALSHKGKVLLEQGKFNEAITWFTEMVRTVPDYPDVQYLLGVSYARKGEYEKSVPLFEAALRLKPNWPDAYNDLALAYLLIGKYEPAIRNYNESLRLKPDNPAAINNLGIALKKQADIEAAGRNKK